MGRQKKNRFNGRLKLDNICTKYKLAKYIWPVRSRFISKEKCLYVQGPDVVNTSFEAFPFAPIDVVCRI